MRVQRRFEDRILLLAGELVVRPTYVEIILPLRHGRVNLDWLSSYLLGVRDVDAGRLPGEEVGARARLLGVSGARLKSIRHFSKIEWNLQYQYYIKFKLNF